MKFLCIHLGLLLQVGKGRLLIEGDRVALLGYGSAVQSCLAAAALVETHGLRLTVADARFCKPLDHALIRALAKSHEVLITVEEGGIGGFGSHVAQFMALDGLLDGTIKVWNFESRLWFFFFFEQSCAMVQFVGEYKSFRVP